MGTISRNKRSLNWKDMRRRIWWENVLWIRSNSFLLSWFVWISFLKIRFLLMSRSFSPTNYSPLSSSKENSRAETFFNRKRAFLAGEFGGTVSRSLWAQREAWEAWKNQWKPFKERLRRISRCKALKTQLTDVPSLSSQQSKIISVENFFDRKRWRRRKATEPSADRRMHDDIQKLTEFVRNHNSFCEAKMKRRRDDLTGRTRRSLANRIKERMEMGS